MEQKATLIIGGLNNMTIVMARLQQRDRVKQLRVRAMN